MTWVRVEGLDAMVNETPEHESRVGDLLWRLFLIAFLFLWILGVPIYLWRNEGWIWGLITFAASLAIWLPGLLRLWAMLVDPNHPGWFYSDNFGITKENYFEG